MFDYEFQEAAKKLDLKRLLKPLLAAEQAVARMDERLRALPFRDGVVERLVYHEACAVSLLEGSSGGRGSGAIRSRRIWRIISTKGAQRRFENVSRCSDDWYGTSTPP
jgi:hypothetical protein